MLRGRIEDDFQGRTVLAVICGINCAYGHTQNRYLTVNDCDIGTHKPKSVSVQTRVGRGIINQQTDAVPILLCIIQCASWGQNQWARKFGIAQSIGTRDDWLVIYPIDLQMEIMGRTVCAVCRDQGNGLAQPCLIKRVSNRIKAN